MACAANHAHFWRNCNYLVNNNLQPIPMTTPSHPYSRIGIYICPTSPQNLCSTSPQNLCTTTCVSVPQALSSSTLLALTAPTHQDAKLILYYCKLFSSRFISLVLQTGYLSFVTRKKRKSTLVHETVAAAWAQRWVLRPERSQDSSIQRCAWHLQSLLHPVYTKCTGQYLWSLARVNDMLPHCTQQLLPLLLQ